MPVEAVLAPPGGNPTPAPRPTPLWLLLAGVLLAVLSAVWLAGAWPQPSRLDEASLQASAHRTELVNRLRLAERVLRSIGLDAANTRTKGAAAPGATESRYFASVTIAKEGETPMALLGTVAPVPVLGRVLADSLTAGETVVITQRAAPDLDVRTLMVRRLGGVGNDNALLIGEISPPYLWATERSGADGIGLCVRDQAGATLNCSSRQVRAAMGVLAKKPLVQTGPQQWQAGNEDWSAVSAALTLQSPMTDGTWTVLALVAPTTPGATHWQQIGVPFAAAAAFAAVGIMLVVRRRRATHNRNIDQRIKPSGDSPVPQDVSSHRMALMFERQKRVIQAMADIDRASLSRAPAERLVELAASHLLLCTGCDVLLIGVLDRDRPSSIGMVVASKGGQPTNSEHQEVSVSTVELLALPPDGSWVRDIGGFNLLDAQTRVGVQGAFLLPIYEDGKPIGVISIGFARVGEVDTGESSNARALAGRLGAALTSAARAQALYAYTHFDATTSLPNRQYLKEHLAQQIRQARRDKGRLALLFVDLDGFKKVNASLGHNRADLVLAEAATRMRTCVREEDMVTRFGGDEFVIVLPRINEGLDARRVADKLLESIGQPYQAGGDAHHIGCSIGISVFPDDAQTVDKILRNADSAMFSAKEAGRGCYRFFDATVNRAAAGQAELERDMRRALANQEFTVAYQPQIDMRTGAIDGVEALVRWPHPSRGMVSPVEFIGLAERCGLIAQIGEFVMRTACAQFRAWETENIAPQRLSVNVSGLEVARTDIVARIESVLRDCGLRPMHLELELTEGVFLDPTHASIDKLTALRERGVRIAIDDFGTGYSSLGYLQRLPIDVIKIDQSFVRQIENMDSTGSIVRAILEVAHSLGKPVVAEGIETERQRELLAEWGCDVGQGYLWSRPLAAPEFGNFCRAWHAARESENQP